MDFCKLSNIVIEPSDAGYGETVNLICDITDFNPKEICTQWFLGNKSITNGVVTEDLDLASNGCYKLSSVLELRATAPVCDKAICFKASHAKLTKPITREVYLKLPGAYQNVFGFIHLLMLIGEVGLSLPSLGFIKSNGIEHMRSVAQPHFL